MSNGPVGAGGSNKLNGVFINHNMSKYVKGVSNIAGSGAAFDASHYRGVTDHAGGVFGVARREVTEFDLQLVYKH